MLSFGMMSAVGTVKTIEGDLLAYGGDGTSANAFLFQQCCCTSTRTAGLSQAIAKKWPALNPYKKRKPIGRSYTATPDTCAEPGTAELLTSGDVNLVCLYAQYSPGKPSAAETAAMRLTYFKDALEEATTLIPEGSTLYFPYGIGCGLAGGKWEQYYAAIQVFARLHNSYSVVIVKLP